MKYVDDFNQAPVQQRGVKYVDQTATPTVNQGNSLLGKYAQTVNKGYEAFKNFAPVRGLSSAVGAGVGAFGGVIGSGVGVIGETGKQLIHATKGEGFDAGKILDTSAQLGEQTSGFGHHIGEEAAPQALLGAAGKIPQALLATGTMAQGAEDVKKGNYLSGGAEILLGGAGMKQAYSTKGFIIDKAVKDQIANSTLGQKVSNVVKPLADKLPSMSKTAETFSNVPARTFEAATDPKLAPYIAEQRPQMDKLQEGSVVFGQDIYGQAQKTVKEASQKWQTTKESIVRNNPDFDPLNAGRDAQFSAMHEFTNPQERIKINRAEDGLSLDFSGTKYKVDREAQDKLQDVMHIVTEKPSSIEDVLDNQSALATLHASVNQESNPNLKRLIGNVKSAYDSSVDSSLGDAASSLKSEYAKAVGPARKVMSSLAKVDSRGKLIFSADKARSFVSKAMQDFPTDANIQLSELDNVVGGDFANKAKAMGIAKALAQLDPPSKGRAFDYYKAKIASSNGVLSPIIGSMFSPYVWGSHFIKQGMEASKALSVGRDVAQEISSDIIKQMITSAEVQSLPSKK